MKNKKRKQLILDKKDMPQRFKRWSEKVSKSLGRCDFNGKELEVLNELERLCQNYIKRKAKENFNQRRLKSLDDKKSKRFAKAVLSKEEIRKLPEWIKGEIDKAHVIGNSGKVIFLNGKKFHLDNPLNDLTGGEWTYFLRSVMNTRYSTSGREGYAHHIRKIHPSPKPPQLMKNIIEFFTKKNEWVLDYFMGVGGTLLGASLCGRRAIGIDLSKKFINGYKDASKDLKLKVQSTLHGDALRLLNSVKVKNILGKDKVSLICIDPPYGDMMGRKKTGEAIKKKKSTKGTPFTDSEHDLGNLKYKSFLVALKESVEKAIVHLKKGRYLAVFTKDFQPTKATPNLLHADIIYKLNEINNLKYVGMKIWVDESINLYPYGYPWAFVSNQLHQYILFFRKDR